MSASLCIPGVGALVQPLRNRAGENSLRYTALLRGKIVYDNLHLHFSIPKPLHHFEAALFRSAAFADCNGEVDEHGSIRVQFRGLRIEYRPGQYWGRIRGSLHTFAQGSNVGVFTAGEVMAACTGLASSLNLPPEIFIVRKLETGVNLAVPTSPEAFLGTLVHHKGKPFWAVNPPSGLTRPLEFVALHSAYKLKYYDKGAYALRQGIPLPMGCRHLLRFEVVFTRARNLQQLTGREQLTLADLPTPHVLTAVAEHLYKHWNLTVRRISMDYANVPFNHAALLKAGSELEWWEAVRPYTPKSTFVRNKALFRKLQKQVAQREAPHPYNLLLPSHLEALLPAEQRAPILKSGTDCHTCNQLEVGKERMPWRGSSPAYSVGEKTNDALPPSIPILRVRKGACRRRNRGEIPENAGRKRAEVIT